MKCKIGIFKKTVLAAFAAMLLILAGCAKEDRDNCGGFRLQFRYTYNSQGQDKLLAQIHDIRVYVFNRSTGVLADIIRVNQQDLAKGYVNVEFPAGTYTLVAWAGSGNDLLQGGFKDANMTNPAAHAYSPQARIGEVTLDNFRMMLQYDQLATGMRGDITPQAEQFDDLFFAMVNSVTVSESVSKTVNFDFIKNTSVLKIQVTGIDYLTRAAAPGQPLDLFVIARNGRYKYDNTIDGYARELRYEPAGKVGSKVMDIDIKVLRLDIARHSADPVLLYIQKPGTGFDMILPLNIVETILKLKNAQGALVYKTQEDIDREDEFVFDISILHDLSVTVTVNGFEIENLVPNLK